MHRVLIVLACLIVGACGGLAGPARTPDAAPTTRPAQEMASSIYIRGLNDMVSMSDAAVEAKIVSISEPMWNQGEGEPLPDDMVDEAGGHVDRPKFQYRNITLSTESAVFDSGRIDVSPGSELVVVQISEEHAMQLLSPGDRILGLVTTVDLPYQDGSKQERLQFMGGLTGVWRIDVKDGTTLGTSAYPNRSAPFDLIKQRIAEERAAGRDRNRDLATDPVNDPFRAP